MVSYRREGVLFQWSRLEELDTCLWRSEVSIEDACHKIEGELLICSADVNGRHQYQWVLMMGEDRAGYGDTGSKHSPDLAEFIQIAEFRTAEILHERFRQSQENTKMLQQRQAQQQRRADALGEILQQRSEAL